MQPARFRQDDILLVEINNAKSTSPAVSSWEERGLLSRTAAGNRAYVLPKPYASSCSFRALVQICRFTQDCSLLLFKEGIEYRTVSP